MSISNKKILFKRISEGDKKAFDTFFENYYPKLIQFARVFVDSEQHAEDVVSEVLTNMLINRKKIFTLSNFEGYLYTSIKNKSLSFIRKNQVENNYMLDECSKPVKFEFTDPHYLLVEEEFNTIIYNVINDLPPKRKMVFQLIREDELSYNKVAELLDISDRTVEVHLRLAVKAIRQRVEEYLKHDVMHLVEN